jgi:Autophagy-related protein 27
VVNNHNRALQRSFHFLSHAISLLHLHYRLTNSRVIKWCFFHPLFVLSGTSRLPAANTTTMRHQVLNSSLFLSLLTLPLFVTANKIDCNHIRVDKTSFDLSPLAGPYSVSKVTEEGEPAYKLLNITFDLCAPLKRPKGISKSNFCPGGGTQSTSFSLQRYPSQS